MIIMIIYNIQISNINEECDRVTISVPVFSIFPDWGSLLIFP